MQFFRRNSRFSSVDFQLDPPPSPWHRDMAANASIVDRLLTCPQALPMSEMVVLLGMVLLAVSTR